MSISTAPPRLPTYNLARIEVLRERLADDVLLDYYGSDCSGDTFRSIVRVLSKALYCKRNIVEDSIRYLAGQRLTDQQIRILCWRLAGNMQRMRKGCAAPPWSFQIEQEWVPVHVRSCTSEIDRFNKPGGRFLFQSLAGTPCPMQFTTFWSPGLCSLIARQVGYTGRYGKRPYNHMTELVNLYLYVNVDPQYCIQGRIGFRQVTCPGSFLKRNKVTIDRRLRRQGDLPWPCPNGYTIPCYKCFVGYQECPAGVRPLTQLPTENTANDPNQTASQG